MWKAKLKRWHFKVRHPGIRGKLLLLVLPAILAPMLLFGALAIGTAGDVLTKEIQSGNLLYATMTKARMEAFSHAREGDARLLSSSRILRENMETLNAFSADKQEQVIMGEQFRPFSPSRLSNMGIPIST